MGLAVDLGDEVEAFLVPLWGRPDAILEGEALDRAATAAITVRVEESDPREGLVTG